MFGVQFYKVTVYVVNLSGVWRTSPTIKDEAKKNFSSK